MWDEDAQEWIVDQISDPYDQIRVTKNSTHQFKITIINTGGQFLDYTVIDDLSSQFNYTNGSSIPLADFESSKKVIWNGNLNIGETINFTYSAQAVELCYGWNTANVTATSAMGNVSDEITLPVKVIYEGQPFIDITKQVKDAQGIWTDHIRCRIDDELQFRIIIDNTMNDPVSNITVTDILPSIAEYVIGSSYVDGTLQDPSSIDPLTWLWSFPDELPIGETIITYSVTALHEGWGSNVATVTMMINNCPISNVDSVFLDVIDLPIVQLTYPKGGETVDGAVDIQWFATDSHDNPDIHLFYSPNDWKTWRRLADVLHNDPDLHDRGSYNWDTTDFSDGYYLLKVEAINEHNCIDMDTSDQFLINNENPLVKISDISIYDNTIQSNSFCKNGDNLEISAAITGGYGITKDSIYADLSGFGKTSSAPNTYDGFIATWNLYNVYCTPQNGEIVTKIELNDGLYEKSANILADNSIPELTITKPNKGIYLYNSLFMPWLKTFIIGPIDIEIECSSDVLQSEIYMDGVLVGVDNDPQYEWYLNEKTIGNHDLTIIVSDGAGNIASISQNIRLFNIL